MINRFAPDYSNFRYISRPKTRADLKSTVAGETSTDGAADKSLSASPDFRLHFGARPPINTNNAAGATLYSSITTGLLLFAFLLLCTQK
uniref:Uncharacterized protein n=1 Tax=Globodera rostochiensis TaxID=31243 RepID=A0A914HJC7_GLORO